MIDFQMKVNGARQINQRLGVMTKNVRSFTAPLRDIKNAFVRYQRAEFESEGSHGGYAWAPLSEKYAAYKRRKRPGKRILEYSGDLRKSMTSRLQANVGPRRLIMWSDSDVAGYHQDGTSKMPARKMVAIPTQEKRDWVRFLQRHIMGSR